MKYVILLILLISPFSVGDDDIKTTAKSALVVDIDSKSILYQQNIDDVRPIASLTKLMTALVILESKSDLNEILYVTKQDYRDPIIRSSSHGRFLPLNIALTREQLLTIMLTNSHNLSTIVLTRAFPGGIDAFVEKMNDTASRIGMVDTWYVDPTGIYKENVSTARDISLLVHYIIENQNVIGQFSSSSNTEVQFGEQTLRFNTTNALVNNPDWAVLIQKTGTTKAAGRCMVIGAIAGNQRILIILLNSSSRTSRITDAVMLERWIETGISYNTRELTKELFPKLLERKIKQHKIKYRKVCKKNKCYFVKKHFKKHKRGVSKKYTKNKRR